MPVLKICNHISTLYIKTYNFPKVTLCTKGCHKTYHQNPLMFIYKGEFNKMKDLYIIDLASN